MRSAWCAAVAAMLWWTMPVDAGVPSVGECFEGAEFIANAARARDAGMKRAAFLDRMEEDFVAIRAFPEPLRWFVRDADDERFLRESAARVFDVPQAPERHGATFLADCLPRTGGGQGPRAGAAALAARR